MNSFVKEHWKWLSILAIFYFFLSFLTLINWGIFWDDWWIISLERMDFIEALRQTGRPYLTNFHMMLLESAHPLVSYRAILFFSGLVNLFCIYYILEKGLIKNKYWAFWTSALYLSIPLNFAKLSLSCLFYFLCLTIFNLAFALIVINKNNISIRVLTNCLFFLSFLTNSLVCFYSIVLLYLLLESKGWETLKNPARLKQFIKSNFDLIVLPIIFVFFKYFILPKPYGIYSGYNSVQISTSIFLEIWKSFVNVLNNFIIFSPSHGKNFINGSIAFLILYSATCLKKSSAFFEDNLLSLNKKYFINVLAFAAVSIFMAVIPYVLIGRLGISFGAEWQDRDNLLLPFGYSLFFLCLITFILSSEYLKNNFKFKKLVGVYLPAILFFYFSTLNINTQIKWLKDAIKQDAIVNYMKNEDGFNKTFTYQLNDHIPEYNAYSRVYREYELSGMAQKVFKNQKRYFATNNKDLNLCTSENKINNLCKEWSAEKLTTQFEIDKVAENSLTPNKILTLVLYKFSNSEKYEKELPKYFSFKLTKL